MGWIDYAVLIFYFVTVLTVGLWFGRGERNTIDFFLGGRRQHWLMVGFSIIATEVSALTFLIVPGRSFEGDCWYLQLYAGSFVGRMLIIVLFLPAFYKFSVTTVYEYLGRRFGPMTRTTASLMFFASRIVGSGIRLLAASLAIALLFDWPLVWVVIGCTGLAVFYTTFGGIKAIIYTDMVQAFVFLGGAIAAIIYLFYIIPGSWMENLSTAQQMGKFNTFTWGWDPNNDKIFWVLMIHATFQNMAALGTDQDLTQRMLTCPDLKRGQRSLFFNAFATLPVVCMFLLIGALIYVYAQSPDAIHFFQDGEAAPDRLFASFISNVLPVGYGLKGLLVAGIFAAAMSSLDSALGALSSTAVTDIYRRFIKPDSTTGKPPGATGNSPGATGSDPSESTSANSMDKHYLKVARIFTIFFGVLLAVVALSFAGSSDLLEEAFGWVGLIFGGMLGVFLLGVTTQTRGRDGVNVLAMLSSVAILIALKSYQEYNQTVYIAWPWWVVIGTIWTYLIGACCRTHDA